MEPMDDSTREGEIRERLADVTGPDPDAAERALVAKLIRSFLARTPAAVDRLGELLRGGDPGEVRDHAHSLKGSAANLGAATLAGVFEQVEEAARDGVVADPDVTLGRAAAELAPTLSILERLADEYERPV
jgi:HPt (histidine-containing phosphotransfer) domain-containing protein